MCKNSFSTWGAGLCYYLPRVVMLLTLHCCWTDFNKLKLLFIRFYAFSIPWLWNATAFSNAPLVPHENNFPSRINIPVNNTKVHGVNDLFLLNCRIEWALQLIQIHDVHPQFWTFWVVNKNDIQMLSIHHSCRCYKAMFSMDVGCDLKKTNKQTSVWIHRVALS